MNGAASLLEDAVQNGSAPMPLHNSNTHPMSKRLNMCKVFLHCMATTGNRQRTANNGMMTHLVSSLLLLQRTQLNRRQPLLALLEAPLLAPLLALLLALLQALVVILLPALLQALPRALALSCFQNIHLLSMWSQRCNNHHLIRNSPTSSGNAKLQRMVALSNCLWM